MTEGFSHPKLPLPLVCHMLKVLPLIYFLGLGLASPGKDRRKTISRHCYSKTSQCNGVYNSRWLGPLSFNGGEDGRLAESLGQFSMNRIEWECIAKTVGSFGTSEAWGWGLQVMWTALEMSWDVGLSKGSQFTWRYQLRDPAGEKIRDSGDVLAPLTLSCDLLPLSTANSLAGGT